MTETPEYTIIRKDGKIELRQYPSYIQAEVEIADSSYQGAIFKGFRILADYIFGSNQGNRNIAMTRPVQVSEGQKIAMTKPVTVRGEGTYSVAFIMPSDFTLATLPEPKNSEITFAEIKPKTMASIGFTGFYREKQVKKAENRLTQWLKNEGITMDGAFISAGYNPPWVPWFLARNEVMVPIRM